MGELIRTVGKLHVGSVDLDIEINEPQHGQIEKEVHIQNPKVRLSVSEKEFLQMGAAVLLARKQLHLLKNGGAQS